MPGGISAIRGDQLASKSYVRKFAHVARCFAVERGIPTSHLYLAYSKILLMDPTLIVSRIKILLRNA